MKKAVRYTIVGLFIAAIPAAVIGYNIYALVEFLGIRDLEQNGIAKEAKVVAKEVSGTTRNNTFRVTLRYPSGVGIDSITTEEVIDDQLYGILHVTAVPLFAKRLTTLAISMSLATMPTSKP
ncbi:MAG: hypothetical protein IPP17_14690 [Bacteroidetes bacterium]|nr:hypothetical protein [Bacteroidota bacterium]